MRSNDVATNVPLVETIESGPRSVDHNKETVVVARIGEATAWDVYIDVSGAWVASGVTMKIYCRSGGERKEITSFALTSAATPSAAFAGDICSIRGVPVTAIEVVILQTTGSTISGGNFRLRAWVGDEQRLVALAPDLKRLTSAPVRLFDGTNDVGTAAQPLITRAIRPGRTYSAVSAATSTGTTTGTTVVLAALWGKGSDPNKHEYNAEILRVIISYTRATGGEQPTLTFGARYCTTAPSGGSTVDPAPWDGTDSGDDKKCFFYSAPTNTDSKPSLFGAVVDPATNGVIVWEPASAGQPLIIPKAANRGIVVQSTLTTGANLTSAGKAVVTIQWIEVP